MKHDDVGSPLADSPTFVGGLLLRMFRGYPAARLDLCSEGLRLGPSTWLLRPLVPVRTFRYDDLREVQATGNRGHTFGIRFAARSTGDVATFYSWREEDRTAILDALEELGVTITRTPERLPPIPWAPDQGSSDTAP